MASVLLVDEERRFGLATPHEPLDNATSRSVEAEVPRSPAQIFQLIRTTPKKLFATKPAA